jgi:hypothetical protein
LKLLIKGQRTEKRKYARATDMRALHPSPPSGELREAQIDIQKIYARLYQTDVRTNRALSFFCLFVIYFAIAQAMSLWSRMTR